MAESRDSTEKDFLCLRRAAGLRSPPFSRGSAGKNFDMALAPGYTTGGDDYSLRRSYSPHIRCGGEVRDMGRQGSRHQPTENGWSS